MIQCINLNHDSGSRIQTQKPPEFFLPSVVSILFLKIFLIKIFYPVPIGSCSILERRFNLSVYGKHTATLTVINSSPSLLVISPCLSLLATSSLEVCSMKRIVTCFISSGCKILGKKNHRQPKLQL